MPVSALHTSETSWQHAKGMTIGNNRLDFESLDSAIREHVASPQDAAIAIDQTGRYSEPLVYFLQQRGYSPCFVEPKGVRGLRRYLLDQENKTDWIDAAGFAYLLYLQETHGTSFRIGEVQAEMGSKATILRSLILQRLQYNKMCTQSTNRLRQLLTVVFPEAELKHFSALVKVVKQYPTPRRILRAAEMGRPLPLRKNEKAQLLALAATTVGVPGRIYGSVIQHLARLRADAMKRRDTLTRLIHNEVNRHPYGQVLLSFPMLGDITAATLISVIKDITRWPDDRKLRKALGVYPVTMRSGQSLSRTEQGREGDKHARTALFQVAVGCLSWVAPPNDFRDYYLRQVSRGKPKKKALMSTAGKLSEIIYHCLTKGENYQYQERYRAWKSSAAPRQRHLLTKTKRQGI